MKKAELKTGMLVELQNGTKYYVLKGTTEGNVFAPINGTGLTKVFAEYNADLTNKRYETLDIVAVYNVENLTRYMRPEKYRAVWRRGTYDRVCLAQFPNTEKEYAFAIPKEFFSVGEGDKVLVETRNGHKTFVKVSKIFANDEDAYAEISDIALPLCSVVDTYKNTLGR